MYLFIATIFIAELIIALAIIHYIIKADKYVLELNDKVVDLQPVIHKTLVAVNEFVITFGEKMENLFEFVQKKRNQYISRITKTLILYLLLFVFKGRCKRAAMLCQGLVLAKDYWDGLSA